ncbi:MAG: Ger(x)C family spore germination protein [Bacillota bacterium]
MNGRIKVKTLLPAVLLLALLVAGCWDLREVEDLGYVLATAIDRAPGNRVKVIVQLPNPRVVGGGGPRGAVTPSASVASKPYRNYAGTGATMFDAIRAISQESARRLFFAQNRTVIISERMAREGLREVLDFLSRSVEIRRHLTMVFVVRGDPAQILDVPNPHSPMPALRIDDIVKWRGQTSRFAPVPLSRFLEFLSLEGAEPYAGVIEAVPNPTYRAGQGERDAPEPPRSIRLRGAALFRGDRLVGFLNEAETRGLLWALSEVRGAQVVFPLPGGRPGEQGTAEIQRARGKIEPEVIRGRIVMTIKVFTEGNLAEVEGTLDLSRPEVMEQLDRALAAAIRGEVLAAVEKTQEAGADVFGFGEAFHRKFPREWKRIKKNWPELFRDLEVRVEVKATIRRTGMIGKPRPILVP